MWKWKRKEVPPAWKDIAVSLSSFRELIKRLYIKTCCINQLRVVEAWCVLENSFQDVENNKLFNLSDYIYKNQKVWRAHFFLTLSHQGKLKLNQENNLSFQMKAEKMWQSPSTSTEASNTFYYWREKPLSLTLDMRGERFWKRPLKLDLLEIQQCQGNQLDGEKFLKSSSNYSE